MPNQFLDGKYDEGDEAWPAPIVIHRLFTRQYDETSLRVFEINDFEIVEPGPFIPASVFESVETNPKGLKSYGDFDTDGSERIHITLDRVETKSRFSNSVWAVYWQLPYHGLGRGYVEFSTLTEAEAFYNARLREVASATPDYSEARRKDWA